MDNSTHDFPDVKPDFRASEYCGDDGTFKPVPAAVDPWEIAYAGMPDGGSDDQIFDAAGFQTGGPLATDAYSTSGAQIFFAGDQVIGPYLACVTIGDGNSDYQARIYVRNIGDLLKLAALIEPWTRLMSYGTIEALTTIARKFFEASHGHHFMDSCGRCDRHLMEARRSVREAREGRAGRQ